MDTTIPTTSYGTESQDAVSQRQQDSASQRHQDSASQSQSQSSSPLPPITSYTDSELSEYHTLLVQTRTHYERILQDTASFAKCSPTEQFAIHLCLRETTNDLEEVVAEMKTRTIG
jgi:hypothetical protein